METKSRGASVASRTWWDATDEIWREILLVNLALEAASPAGPPPTTWLTPAERYEAMTGKPFVVEAGDWSEALHHLEKVDCYGADVSDLAPLAGIQGLREAYCGATKLHDLRPLSGCKGLTNLCLYNTPVASLDPLEELRGLRRLCCANTRVRSLAALSELQHLEFLSISNTAISSLAPIWGLTSLRRLRCHNTKISTEELEVFSREHPYCQVLTTESEEDDFAAVLE